MSTSSSRQSTGKSKKQDPMTNIKSLLGEKFASKVINELNTSNGGDIALTLREIENKFTEEQLIEFVNNYARLEYRKAKRDIQTHNKEEVKKDLLSAKIVIG